MLSVSHLSVPPVALLHSWPEPFIALILSYIFVFCLCQPSKRMPKGIRKRGSSISNTSRGCSSANHTHGREGLCPSSQASGPTIPLVDLYPPWSVSSLLVSELIAIIRDNIRSELDAYATSQQEPSIPRNSDPPDLYSYSIFRFTSDKYNSNPSTTLYCPPVHLCSTHLDKYDIASGLHPNVHRLVLQLTNLALPSHTCPYCYLCPNSRCTVWH